MSDTRAAIRELRSLSEKRSTQGLNAEERIRLDDLRQRLGLPPEPEVGSGPSTGAPTAPQEASAQPVRRPSLAERIDAAADDEAPAPLVDSSALPLPAPVATSPLVSASLNGIATLPIPRFDSPDPLPVEMPAPAVPAAPEPVEAAAPVETLPPFEATETSAEALLPFEPTETSAPGEALPPFEPTETAAEAPPSLEASELGALEAFAPFEPPEAAAEALPSLEASELGALEAFAPFEPPEAAAEALPSLEASELGALEAFPPFEPPEAAAEALPSLEASELGALEAFPPFEPPEAAAEALPSLEAVEPAAGEAFPPFEASPEDTQPGAEPVLDAASIDAAAADEAPSQLAPETPAEPFLGGPILDEVAPDRDADAGGFGSSGSEGALGFLEGAESLGAAELPPDSALPGEAAADGYGAEPLPPDSGVVAAIPAEEGYGAEPLTPAPDPGLLPADGSLAAPGELILAAEDLGATPLDVPDPGETGAQPLDESGPIELSAADVMLLEDEPPRTDLSDLELGGDASEPVPLAEAHDFVQYQRADEGAIAFEPSDDGEGLGDPALLQASEAELATQAAPFIPQPAAPSLRVPAPPQTSAPLPRAVTAPSMPAARPLAGIPAASVPAARPPFPPAPPPTARAAEPMPRPPAPPPAPPPAAAAPRPPSRPTPLPFKGPPTPAPALAPTPLPFKAPLLPAPALRPTPPPFKWPATAPTPPPAAAAAAQGTERSPTAFPVLTATPPVSTESPPVKSGPFARPPQTLMPSVLDTMDDEPPPFPPSPASQPAVFGGAYLSPTFVEGEHRVVLHTLEGQVRRGMMSDVDLLDPVIRLNPAGPTPDAIPADRIKAIFFMQGPGDAPLPQNGQRIRVSFSDGRQIVGFSEDVEVGENGFFLVPADLRTHTARIYVFRAGVHSITRA